MTTQDPRACEPERCATCGLELEDERDTLEPHECPPGFTAQVSPRAKEAVDAVVAEAERLVAALPDPDPAAVARRRRPTTTNDPRAWRVAIALGLESGLDWSRWAAGHPSPRIATASPAEMEHAAWAIRALKAGRYNLCPATEGFIAEYRALHPTPVPAPWDADAYLADVARRGVEPGPLPSLEHHGSDGVSWLVSDICATAEIGAACWMTVCTSGAVHIASNDDGCEHTDLDRLSTLATAAAKAMVGP